MTTATEYVLIQDGDCHWYVCPAGKKAEAEAYFEAAARFWNPSPRVRPGIEPKEPEWLERVGGAPSLVKFTGYRIE